MTTPGAFVRTEIRFLQADDYFVDEKDRLCRKVGRRMPLQDNTRLGIKHLAVCESPYSRKILEYRAQAPVWTHAEPSRRSDCPIERILEEDAA